MAKEYLSIEEAVAEFGLTEGRISDLVADGKIREYRDAGKIYLKRNEVEAAASEGSSIVDLSADDDGGDTVSLDDNEESFASALSSLADSSMALGAIDESPAAEDLPELGSDAGDDTGGSISFADDTGSELSLDDIPEDLPAMPMMEDDNSSGDTGEYSSEVDLLGDTGDAPTLQPTEEATADEEIEPVNLDEMPDLGLSGSSIISLEPSGGDSAAPKQAAKEDTQVTNKPKEDSGLGGGISVFDEDELGIESDPLGETQISSGLAEFDAVGSGSGLLDLTQESDDTSLGAELLDVISPTEVGDTEVEVDSFEADTITEDVGVATMEDEDAIGGAAMAPAPAMAARSSAAAGTMPGSVPMNIMMGFGILAMALLGLATASVLQGVWPAAIMDVISRGIIHVSVFGGLILVSIVLGIMAILAGRK